jgi:HemY protein
VIGGYLGFYALARLVATLVAIPERVRTYREERTRARMRQSLSDSLLAFFQGRYASAERSAAAALLGEETKGVAAIIAARSAHELGRFNERESSSTTPRARRPMWTRHASPRSPTCSFPKVATRRRSRS